MPVARTEEEALRTCPTCGTEVGKTSGLGLRDYRIINDKLPGKVGLMDIDGMLERKGHVLMFEFKPIGAGISMGARISFKALVRKGITVWVVWSDGDAKKVEVGEIDRRGDVGFVEKMPLAKFIRKIAEWYEAADRGEL